MVQCPVTSNYCTACLALGIRPKSVRPNNNNAQIGTDTKTPPPGPRSFTKRAAGVRLGSGGRVWYVFSRERRPLRPPRRGAAAGGAALLEQKPYQTRPPDPSRTPASRLVNDRAGWGLYMGTYRSSWFGGMARSTKYVVEWQAKGGQCFGPASRDKATWASSERQDT